MAVSFVSAGDGNRTTGSSTTLGASWSHTIATSGLDVVVLVGVVQSVTSNAAPISPTAVTYGGLTMARVGTITLGSTTERSAVSIYSLWNPPTGAQTVAVTTATDTKTAVAGQSVAYSGVAALELGATGNGTTASVTVTIPTGGMGFAVMANGASITSVNRTERYRTGSSVGGRGDYIAVQDTATTGSVAFTFAGTATTPAAQAVVMRPAQTPPGGQLVALDTTPFAYGAGNYSFGHILLSSGAGATLSSNMITGGSDRALLVVVSSATVTETCAVTYGGVPMTSLVKLVDQSRSHELFGLLGGPLGNNSIDITISASVASIWLQAMSFNGVKSFSGAASSTLASTTSLSISSAVGDMAFGWVWSTIAPFFGNGLGYSFQNRCRDTTNQLIAGYAYGSSGTATLTDTAATTGSTALAVNMVGGRQPSGDFFAMF